MSAKNLNLIKNNAFYGIKMLSPDLNGNITNKRDRKANLMRRKNFTSGKLYPLVVPRGEMSHKCPKSIDTRLTDKKKLRSAKELENCRTARSHSANSVKDNAEEKCFVAMRTRSVSPTPSTPPLKAELPLKKFYSYAAKIIDQFELLKIFISHQSDEAESLHDLNRQRKRATEFSIRFSRNNLYQMKRIVNEIKQIIVPYPFENLAKTDSDILCKKVLLAYQTATQALQTYINYMKSGQSLDVPEKTRELIMLIIDLQLCCEHLSLPGNEIDLLTSCKELIVLLDGKIAESTGYNQVTRLSEKYKEPQKEDKRFSMYKTKLTSGNWKKKTESLAKIKFGAPKLSHLKKIKKKESSVTIPKDTFDVYSQRVQESNSNKKYKKTGSVISGKSAKQMTLPPPRKTYFTPREVTSQDDDIETLVQRIEDDQAISHRIQEESADSTYGNLYEDDKNLKKNNVRELVMQAINEIQSDDKHDVNQSLKKLLKSLNNPSTSVQPRNVKLLHIISNEPIPENPEEELAEEIEEQKNSIKRVGTTNEEPSACESMMKNGKMKTIFKYVSTKKSSADIYNGERALKIPKELSNSIIKYKKIFNEYRRNNVMYKRGMSVRPCELVLRISDQIIDQLLLEISCGMENESLLQQLYYNELLEVM